MDSLESSEQSVHYCITSALGLRLIRPSQNIRRQNGRLLNLLGPRLELLHVPIRIAELAPQERRILGRRPHEEVRRQID